MTAPSKTHPAKTHPDGGWGWCIVGAGFITQFVVVGLQNSAGVVYNELAERYKGESRAVTGFACSIASAMMFLCGPLTTCLCQRFGIRKVAICGSLLCIAGLLSSAFAPSLKVMIVTYGLTWGLGTSFCYFSTVLILVQYFDVRLGLVNGIVASGSGAGTLALSPFLQWFAHSYGFKNMLFLLAGLHGLVLCVGLVFSPVGEEYRNGQSELHHQEVQSSNLDNSFSSTGSSISSQESAQLIKRARSAFKETTYYSLLTNKAFVSWCVGLAAFMVGYFVPFVHLVRYAKTVGVAEHKGALLISIFSVSSTVLKVAVGKIAGMKCVDKVRLYQSGLGVIGAATIMVTLSKSFYYLVAYSLVIGFGEAVFIVVIPLVTKDIVGLKQLPTALGCVFMCMGIPSIFGVPLAGLVYDYVQNYAYVFYFAGAVMVLGSLIITLVSCFSKKKHAGGECEKIKPGKGVRSITEAEDGTKLRIEEIKRRPESMVMEYTFYGSSQRIFYSEVETKELNDALEAQKQRRAKEFLLSNTSLYEPSKIIHDKLLQVPVGNFLTPQPHHQRWSTHLNPEDTRLDANSSLYRNSWCGAKANDSVEYLHPSPQRLTNGLSITALADDEDEYCIIECPPQDDDSQNPCPV